MKNNTYLPVIISLRGFAALAVCFFHFSKGFVDEASITREIFRYGWMGVEVFFVISGFVIPYSLLKSKFSFKNYGGFLKKRFVRIEPAYLISIVVIILLNYCSTLVAAYQGTPFSISHRTLLLHLGYLINFFDEVWLSPVYWTLEIEFHYYLLIGLLIALWNRSNTVLLKSSIVLLLLVSLIPEQQIALFTYIDIFCLGICIAFLKKELFNKKEFLLFLGGVACMVFYNHGIIIGVLTFATALLITYFETFANYKFFIFLGNISFSLYLLHVPIGGRIVNLAKRYDLNEFGQGGVILLALLISVLAAWGFYKLVEQPSHLYSKKIKLKFK